MMHTIHIASMVNIASEKNKYSQINQIHAGNMQIEYFYRIDMSYSLFD